MLDNILLKKLGIITDVIDINKSYMSYNSTTCYNIINMHLKKEDKVICPICASANISIRGTPIKETKSGMYMTKYQIVECMLTLSDKLKLAYVLKEEYRNFVATATIDTADILPYGKTSTNKRIGKPRGKYNDKRKIIFEKTKNNTCQVEYRAGVLFVSFVK